MTEAIDITGFLPTDVSVIDMMKPGTTEPTGWKITLAGPSHPQTVAWSNEASRKHLRRQAAIEQAQVNGRKFKAEDRSPDDVRRESVESVVNRIVTWTPVKIGSEVIDFSREAAVELLLRPQMASFYIQIIEALGDEKVFTTTSAKP